MRFFFPRDDKRVKTLSTRRSKSQESVAFFMYKAQNTRILSYFSTVFAIMVKSLRTARCQRLVTPLPCPP